MQCEAGSSYVQSIKFSCCKVLRCTHGIEENAYEGNGTWPITKTKINAHEHA